MKIVLILLVCGLIENTKEDELCNLPTYSPNLAKFSRACMSSSVRGVPFPGPERGVDGITETNHTLFTCSVTNLEFEPYYQVDLDMSFIIGKVIVINRQDCCWHWLEGAKILVGDEPGINSPVCATIKDCSNSRPRMVFDCNGMQGRYVTVVHYNTSGIISLCELQVYQQLVQQKSDYDEYNEYDKS